MTGEKATVWNRQHFLASNPNFLLVTQTGTYEDISKAGQHHNTPGTYASATLQSKQTKITLQRAVK